MTRLTNINTELIAEECSTCQTILFRRPSSYLQFEDNALTKHHKCALIHKKCRSCDKEIFRKFNGSRTYCEDRELKVVHHCPNEKLPMTLTDLSLQLDRIEKLILDMRQNGL